jgi:hypothetical protein
MNSASVLTDLPLSPIPDGTWGGEVAADTFLKAQVHYTKNMYYNLKYLVFQELTKNMLNVLGMYFPILDIIWQKNY